MRQEKMLIPVFLNFIYQTLNYKLNGIKLPIDVQSMFHI